MLLNKWSTLKENLWQLVAIGYIELIQIFSKNLRNLHRLNLFYPAIVGEKIKVYQFLGLMKDNWPWKFHASKKVGQSVWS